MKPNQILKLLTRLSKRESADIFLFNGAVQDDNADKFRTMICEKKPKNKNAIIFLTTYGGYPDAAYRMGACLKRHYTRFAFYVFGYCKSAGTLITLGADSIVVGDYGELGPLDVQLIKPDEIIPTSSGLDIFQALAVIQNSAFETFERYFLSLIERSGGSMTAKTAADIATSLAVGLYSPMTGQIDPERLGEVQRAINVANAYGSRLNRGNVKRDALEKLVQGYPTHGFVIDTQEAKTLFHRVRHADALETAIGNGMPFVRRPGKEPVIRDLMQLYSPQQPTPTKGSKGKSHAAKPTPPKAKGAPRASEARTGAAAGNVAQFRGNVAGDASAARENNDPVNRPKGRAGTDRT